MLSLFDISKIIFEKPGEWQDITPGEKRKNFFLLNRRFAIQFPMQANVLQHLKINQAAVMDFWQVFLRKYYNKTPGWMYTKGVKKLEKEKENSTSVSSKLIEEYAKRMKIEKKSIYEALEHYPDLIKKELKNFEKLINQK